MNPSSTTTLSPLVQIGHIDMVGQVLTQLCNNKTGVSKHEVPVDVLIAALFMLRAVRDSLASQNQIGAASVYSTPAYLAEVYLAEINTMELDDDEFANKNDED
jgi:hypothetical protein